MRRALPVSFCTGGWRNHFRGHAVLEGGFRSDSYYGSPPVSTPPFPPGSPYVIDCGGKLTTNYILDPRASLQQVLMVPTVHTNGAGEMVDIAWSYRETNSPSAPMKPPKPSP